jgi:hypothetical protein
MRIDLSDGETFELSDHEAWTLYETLLERARHRGTTSAARKLRPALAWSSGVGTTVVLDELETAAVQAIRKENGTGGDASS